MQVNYPRYVVVRLVPDVFGVIKKVDLFDYLEDACRFAYLKRGKVFGLNPEYEYHVEARAIEVTTT